MSRKIILVAILVGALFVSVYFLISKSRGVDESQPLSLSLEPKISEANGISFEAVPLDFNLQNPVKFEIKIDTHSGSLDFDLVKISALNDDLGNEYKPLEWQGGSGGHHLEGILLFPKLTVTAVKELKLIIREKPPIVFKWSL